MSDEDRAEWRAQRDREMIADREKRPRKPDSLAFKLFFSAIVCVLLSPFVALAVFLLYVVFRSFNQ